MESTWTKAALAVLAEARQEVGPEAVERLHRKAPWRHFALVARQFLFLFGGGAALAVVPHPLAVAPLAALVGLTVFNFTVLLHEQLHQLVFTKPHPRRHRFLGWLYAFWSGISASQFTRWHLDHHANLGSDTLDPKRHHLSPKINARWLKLLYFTPALFFIYFRAAARETAGYDGALRKRIARERLVSVGGHLAIQAALVGFGGWGVWLRVYALPVYAVFPVAFALNRLGQHYAIKTDDPAGWTTWVPGTWFWDFAYLNSNYHLEHHLFPSVPCYHLPELQRRLVPFHERHGLTPRSYGSLFWGYIVRNRAPHTDWK
jgi:fatty acid desaturase